MKEEDFFAPRPKLSRCQKQIRCYAIFYAIGVNIPIFLLEVEVLMRYISRPSGMMPSELGVALLVLTVGQLILLFPAWRCYRLQSWACVAVAIILLFCAMVSGLLIYGSEAPRWLYLIPMFYYVLGLCMLCCEWQDLNKGF